MSEQGRYRRRDARAAFECLEADGVLEIERDGAGWLLFGWPELVSVTAVSCAPACRVMRAHLAL